MQNANCRLGGEKQIQIINKDYNFFDNYFYFSSRSLILANDDGDSGRRFTLLYFTLIFFSFF